MTDFTYQIKGPAKVEIALLIVNHHVENGIDPIELARKAYRAMIA